MHAYCLRKGIVPPIQGLAGAPIYAPIPDPIVVNIEMTGAQADHGANPGMQPVMYQQPGFAGQPQGFQPQGFQPQGFQPQG